MGLPVHQDSSDFLPYLAPPRVVPPIRASSRERRHRHRCPHGCVEVDPVAQVLGAAHLLRVCQHRWHARGVRCRCMLARRAWRAASAPRATPWPTRTTARAKSPARPPPRPGTGGSSPAKGIGTPRAASGQHWRAAAATFTSSPNPAAGGERLKPLASSVASSVGEGLCGGDCVSRFR